MDVNSVISFLPDEENYRALVVPFVLMLIDFVTGIFHAWATGHLKSYKMRDGLNKKVGELALISIGYFLHWAIAVPYYVPAFIAVYVCIMELISICENLDKMGVPIPKFIKSALRNAEYKIQNEDPSKKEGEDR